MKTVRIALLGMMTAACLLTTVTAQAASTSGASMAPAGTHARAASAHSSCPQRALRLAGGLCAVPATGSRRAHLAQPASCVTDQGPVILVSLADTAYAITDQPTTANGRLANHLYMWANNNWSTQKFDLLFNSCNGTLQFRSDYNSNDCINVPGASRSSGVQLIIWPCGNYPNELFVAAIDDFSADNLLLSYDENLSVAIGSNFPGNGAFVITYGTSYSNSKEGWLFAAV